MQVETGVGIVTDFILALVLVFSFIGGLRGGAIKEFLGLAAFVISLPLVGIFTGYVESWFSFVMSDNWRGFISFLVTMGIIMILLHLLFWIPRHLTEKIWEGGFLWSLLGGVFNTMNTSLGLVLLAQLVDNYKLFGSLQPLIAASQVLNWLVNTFGGFILSLMHLFHYPLSLISIFSCAA